MKTPNPQQDSQPDWVNSQHPKFFDDPKEKDKKDDMEYQEDDLNERTDWGHVDPAGGEAPTSPGSAV